MDTRLTTEMIATLQRTLAQAPSSASASTAAASGPTFAAALGDALKTVSQAQQQSGDLQRRFQAGVDGVGIEETMVAMQKAQIGFQAVLAVRNRLVSAYTDIMNMQV